MVAHVGKRRVVGWCCPQNRLSQCIVSYPRIDYYVPWSYSLCATHGAVSTTLVLSIGYMSYYIPTYCAIYEIYMMRLHCSHFHCRFLLLFFVSAYDKIKTKNNNTISLSNKKNRTKRSFIYKRVHTYKLLSAKLMLSNLSLINKIYSLKTNFLVFYLNDSFILNKYSIFEYFT